MAIPEISVDELADILVAATDTGSGSLRLIDVREIDEYTNGHVPGAVLVVLGSVPDNVEVFRGDGPAYIICRSGARSMRACEFLAGHGVEAVNIAGGTIAWSMSGRDVIAGDRPS